MGGEWDVECWGSQGEGRKDWKGLGVSLEGVWGASREGRGAEGPKEGAGGAWGCLGCSGVPKRGRGTQAGLVGGWESCREGTEEEWEHLGVSRKGRGGP